MDEANPSYLATQRRPRIDWAAAVEACERDLLLVKIVLAAIARHETVNDEDAAACQAAATRCYRLIQRGRVVAEVLRLSPQTEAMLNAEQNVLANESALPFVWARDTAPMLDVAYVVKNIIGCGEVYSHLRAAEVR